MAIMALRRMRITSIKSLPATSMAAANAASSTAATRPSLPPPLRKIENEDVDGSFTVDWDPVSAAGTYLLEERKNDTAWTTIYQGPDTVERRSGLADGVYCYRVRGQGANEPGLWSGEQCANVGGVLAVPTLKASDGDYTDRVHLSWSGIPGATHYRLYRNEDSSAEPQLLTANVSGTSHDNLSAAPGPILYYYRIRACKGEQCSKFSEINSRPRRPFRRRKWTTINNDDADGFYTVDWERVSGAERYQLEEQHDGGVGQKIYDDTGTAFLREDRQQRRMVLPRARAINTKIGASDWSREGLYCRRPGRVQVFRSTRMFSSKTSIRTVISMPKK